MGICRLPSTRLSKKADDILKSLEEAIIGTDIHGFIEFKMEGFPECWYKAIDIGSLAERYYNLFGYLFGVREPIDKYLPIAAHRGLPSHVDEVTEMIFKWCEGDDPTWIGWREFHDAVAEGHSVHAYRPGANDQLLPVKRDWTPPYPDYFTENERKWLRRGGGVEKDGYVYRYESDGPISFGPGWQLIVEFGDRLAQVYGDERVRMVVWFLS